ncbi:hypothetical protein ACH4SK_42585 [Streptomyces inhibens]
MEESERTVNLGHQMGAGRESLARSYQEASPADHGRSARLALNGPAPC